MSIHALLPQRAGAACLAAFALLGVLAIDSTPAPAWTKNQTARQERYLACRARIQKDPPCNQNWTRYCARQCHARYY
jgi:hypothetical protein